MAVLGIAAIACSPMSEAGQSDGEPPAVGAPVVGGWSALDPAHADAQVAAAAAVARLPGGGALAGIESAEQQVVAGMNYRLVILLADSRRWSVTIWRKLDGGWELTRSERLADRVEPRLRMAADGLAITGADGAVRTLAFGTAQAAVMQAVAFRGPAGESTNAECGAGPIQFASWPDGVNLLFQDGTFKGWSLDSRADAMTLADGIGIGATLADLRKGGSVAVEETSLGQEFTYRDAISGVLDGKGEKARIDALWAGLSCVFR